MSEIVKIPVDQIVIGDRLRPLDAAWAEALAASIEEKGGLITPISVRAVSEGGDKRAEYYLLNAGLHRLEAHKLLKWETIEAVIDDVDDHRARIDEIDENLMRRELSALDRALFLAERKRVYELMNPETAHGGDRRSKVDILKDKIKLTELSTCSAEFGFKPRFTKEAAEKTGLGERDIQRLVRVASKLSPEAVALLRNTGLNDNMAALLALADTEAGEQLEIAQAIARGDYTSVGHARVGLGHVKKTEATPQQKAQAALLHNWSVADKHTRAAFLKHIGIDPATCQPYGGWTVNGILNPKKKG